MWEMQKTSTFGKNPIDINVIKFKEGLKKVMDSFKNGVENNPPIRSMRKILKPTPENRYQAIPPYLISTHAVYQGKMSEYELQ